MKKIFSRTKRKNKNLKYIVSILLSSLIIYYTNNVKAGMNDSLLEINKVDDIYAIIMKDEKETITNLNIYKMNGIISYSLELEKDITSNKYNSTSDFSISTLTNEQCNYIKSISYFGYEYKEHNDIKYYMAAQELIWEYITDVDVKWSNAPGNKEDINIEEFKETITTLINREKEKKLEFNNEGQAYKVGEEIILEETNNLLNEYEIVSTNESQLTIEDNKLIIKIANKIRKEEIEFKRKQYYNHESKLYYYDTSKKLISNGNYTIDLETLTLNIEGATIEAEVKQLYEGYDINSIDAKLEGAVYELYDENNKLVGTYTSDKSGKFKVDNLLLGKYYFKQIKASEGYILNEELKEITLVKPTNKITLEEKLISNLYVIDKKYGSNGNYYPEMFITFCVYDSRGEFYRYILTDRDGTRNVRLPYGIYKIVQDNAREGYAKADDFIIEVKEPIKGDIYYNLITEKIKTTANVISIDEKTQEQIKLNGFSYKIKNKKENTYLNKDGNILFKSNDKGELLIPFDLEYGNYVIEQLSTPTGVVINEKEIEFSINSDTAVELPNGNFVSTVTINNTFAKGKLIIKSLEEKYNEINNKKELIERSNVEFSLKTNKDIIENGKVIYKANEEIFRAYTNESNTLIMDNLYLGDYCLIEVDTNKKQCFNIMSSDNKTSIVEKEINFITYINNNVNNDTSNKDTNDTTNNKLSTITIKNIDDKGNNIINSTFSLLDKNNKIIYTASTSKEGRIIIDNIPNGPYCIKQTYVNDTHDLNKEKICFNLNDNKEIIFTNNKVIKEIIKIPNTLSKSTMLYDLFVFISLIGTGILVYKKIFKSNLYR